MSRAVSPANAVEPRPKPTEARPGTSNPWKAVVETRPYPCQPDGSISAVRPESKPGHQGDGT